MGASPAAFSTVEAQLLSPGQLASITAKGLEDAKAASWQGEAADQYRSTLAKLPANLNLVTQNYSEALSAMSAFADSTLELKAKYQAFQGNLATMKQHWTTAVNTTYVDQVVGQSTLNALQDEINGVCWQGLLILQSLIDAQQALKGKLGALTGAAPHEGIWELALSPFKDFWDGVTGTWSAISAFANNPSWSNLGKMSSDLAIDASVLVVAAAPPEGAAGVGLINMGADSSVLSGLDDAGTVLKGVGLGENGLATASDFADGEYAEGVLGAWGVGTGLDGALDASEIDEALSKTSLLDRYASQLEANGSAGALSGFTKDEIKELEELVPNATPASVAEAWKLTPRGSGRVPLGRLSYLGGAVRRRGAAGSLVTSAAGLDER